MTERLRLAILLVLCTALATSCCLNPAHNAEHKSYGLFIDHQGRELLRRIEKDPDLDEEAKQDWRDADAAARDVWKAVEGAK